MMTHVTKPEEPQNVLDCGLSLLRVIAETGALVVLALSLVVAVKWTFAAKPPEKVDQINCSVFEAIPILEEVRPFLDDVQAPEQLDFKTRVAYVDDWTKRRAMAAVRLDKLIEVCRIKLSEQKSGD